MFVQLLQQAGHIQGVAGFDGDDMIGVPGRRIYLLQQRLRIRDEHLAISPFAQSHQRLGAQHDMRRAESDKIAGRSIRSRKIK